MGTSHPQTNVTVTTGDTTTVDFGFDIFTCVPGGGSTDGSITPYISEEVTGNNSSSRNQLDTLDDSWRTAAGLPNNGIVTPWLGYDSRVLSNNEPALFSTNGTAVDVALVNIQKDAPCSGNVHTSGTPDLLLSETMQETSPRPASLYSNSGHPAFWNESSGANDSTNAVRFTFDQPVSAFGAWFGDLETRTDGNARPAYLRLLDSSGNRIGADIAIEPTTLFSGGSSSTVDQNQCGDPNDLACGNRSTRWIGFIDSAARVKQVLVIVGDDDFGDTGVTERLSFIGLDIVDQEDHGDAPASYLDAVHALPVNAGIYLGTVAGDDDANSQHAANGGVDGLGDDNDGSDDEDGVAQLPPLSNTDHSYSLNVVVNNTSGNTAHLVGWIDFDGSGMFDSDEAVSVAVPNGTSGQTVALTWPALPADILPGATYLRLRLTTDTNIATGNATTSQPAGTAMDGEVEDHIITITSSGYTLSGTVYHDRNVNAANDDGYALQGVTVVLHDQAGGVCRSTQTAADGSYTFTEVLTAVADNYVVYEAAAENYQSPSTCPPITSDPNGYLSSTPNLQTVTVTNADVTGIDFGDVRQPAFTQDNSQVILPHSSVVYPHQFYSEADGRVLFSISGQIADPAGLNWGVQLYQDTNCDAQLDGGDTVITGSLAVNAGDTLCTLAKVLAPANASSGATHTLTVQSDFTYGDGSSGIGNAVQTRTDITTTASGTSSEPVGGEGKLSLLKSVWNVSRGTTVGDNDGSVALPGEVLRYTIRYENIGNGELDELVIYDTVPEFTVSGGAGQQCGSTPPELTVCTPVELNGELEWMFSGQLQPGSSGEVYYDVVVE
jgi:uncharacterized repeat protein (TIGR01451 family)